MAPFSRISKEVAMESYSTVRNLETLIEKRESMEDVLGLQTIDNNQQFERRALSSPNQPLSVQVTLKVKKRYLRVKRLQHLRNCHSLKDSDLRPKYNW